MRNAVKPSGFERLSRRAALSGWHCFVNMAINEEPLRSKCVPGDQYRNHHNCNHNFCPLFHFHISLNGLISPPSMRTDVPAIHFADVEGTSTGSSCSDAIIVFSWFGKLVAIPRRRAGFSLRCGQRALIEILHEVFREKDIEGPIDRHAHFFFRAWQFAPINTAPEKPGEKSGKIHAKDPRHTGAAADGREQAERFEFE